MKPTASLIIILLLLTLTASAQTAPRAPQPPQQPRVEEDAEEGAEDGAEQSPERTLAVEPDAVVNLCLKSGSVVVRGWDKRELRVRAEAEHVELRPAGVVGVQKQVKNVDVWVADSDDAESVAGVCMGSGNVEIDLPRGATLILKLRSGDIDVSDLAEAHFQSMSGDTDVRRVTRAVDIENVSGSISLSDSSGRVRLLGISGDVDVSNVRPASAADPFSAKTTSGSVNLDRVTHSRVEAGTVSGDVNVTSTGALARDGSYDFKTFSGDVTLTLPADASFKLNATVATGGEISTDFIVKSDKGAQPLAELSQGRLNGTVGNDGAQVNLSSFNGSLRLKKR